ncbi:MAG: ribonuclease H family protein [Clostridia bacterium]|nr:ribonuclease H family protein [Clostridia bacterium]
MKKKYYAVKTGRETGIFLTWDECRNATDGYSGAEYKCFSAKAEAQKYLKGAETVKEDATADPMFFAKDGILTAFVDGSFDSESGMYGFGCVIINPDGTVTEKNGAGINEEARAARNVAGELLGTMTAAAYAIKNGFKKLRVYHDYTGIAKWYNGEWKAESFAAREYIGFMNKTRSHVEIEFVKVDAHTGVYFNERADMLAKEALGLK